MTTTTEENLAVNPDALEAIKPEALPYELKDNLSKQLQRRLDELMLERALEEAKVSKLISTNLANHRPVFVGRPDEKLIQFFYPEWITHKQGRALGFDMTFEMVSQHVLQLHGMSEACQFRVNPMDFAFSPVITTFAIPLSLCDHDFKSVKHSIQVEGMYADDSHYRDVIFPVDKELWKDLERIAYIMKCKHEQPFKALIGLFHSNLLFARIM